MTEETATGRTTGTGELSALRSTYDDVIELVEGLDEPASWRPSGCAGWTVRDLVLHLLSDAQRALVALATPAEGPADVDAVTYWAGAPGRDDPESRGLRATRIIASAWSLGPLVSTYAQTARAVLTAAGGTAPDALLATQGHVLCARDLFATLAVEAAVHHLDLVVHLDRPGPGPAALGQVRRTLDGLLGRPAPVAWDDVTWARAGTGRRPLTGVERTALGPDAARFPLLR